MPIVLARVIRSRVNRFATRPASVWSLAFESPSAVPSCGLRIAALAVLGTCWIAWSATTTAESPQSGSVKQNAFASPPFGPNGSAVSDRQYTIQIQHLQIRQSLLRELYEQTITERQLRTCFDGPSVKDKFASPKTPSDEQSHAAIARSARSDLAKIRGEASPIQTAQITRIEPTTIATTLLGPAMRAEVIRRIQADERSDIQMTPKVTLFEGQLATLADQVQRPFVIGYQTQAGTDVPIIKTVGEGHHWELRVVELPRRVSVGTQAAPISPSTRQPPQLTLSASLNVSRIGQVRTASIVAAHWPEVQIPTVENRTVELIETISQADTLWIDAAIPIDEPEPASPSLMTRLASSRLRGKASKTEPRWLVVLLNVREVTP